MEGTGAIMRRKTRERAQDTVHMRGRTSSMRENLEIIGITDAESVRQNTGLLKPGNFG